MIYWTKAHSCCSCSFCISLLLLFCHFEKIGTCYQLGWVVFVSCMCVLVWDGLVGVRIHGFLSSSWLDCGLGVYGNGSIGCTNNNYASREKCKKCGQPKEVAAMPAIAMPGASLPTYSHYFARAQGGLDQKMNIGIMGNGAPHQSLPLNWSMAGADKYGVQPPSSWSVGGNHNAGLLYSNPTNQLLSVPKGWRSGDWLCNCGFHNYSSRTQVWWHYMSIQIKNCSLPECWYLIHLWFICSAKNAMLFHQVHSFSISMAIGYHRFMF